MINDADFDWMHHENFQLTFRRYFPSSIYFEYLKNANKLNVPKIKFEDENFHSAWMNVFGPHNRRWSTGFLAKFLKLKWESSIYCWLVVFPSNQRLDVAVVRYGFCNVVHVHRNVNCLSFLTESAKHEGN